MKEFIYSEAYRTGSGCAPNEEPLTEDIVSFISVAKTTLEKLKLFQCRGIYGDIMGLADFPCLKEVDFCNCKVTICIGGESMQPTDFSQLEVLNLRNLWGTVSYSGDIRSLKGHHFPKLQTLDLTSRGTSDISGYSVLERISDAAVLMQSLYPLKKRSPSLFKTDDCDEDNRWHAHKWHLNSDSPDKYEAEPKKTSPPSSVVFVQAGPRLGWQWVNSDWRNTSGCEVNWLDPEPCEESDDYARYVDELKIVQQRINVYAGFYGPPTEEEYKRVCVDFEPDYGHHSDEEEDDEDDLSRYYDSEFHSDY